MFNQLNIYALYVEPSEHIWRMFVWVQAKYKHGKLNSTVHYMNLELIGIKDLDTDKERVELVAIGNDNTSNYVLVFPYNYENIDVVNKCKHAFWFPNQSFKKGDTIRVFTKPGAPSFILMANKSKRYTFYWGIGSSAANENRKRPKLLRIIEEISIS